MFDFVWRMFGYKLDKDTIRRHQLARAIAYEEAQKVKVAKSIVKQDAKGSFSCVAIENERPTETHV